MNRQAGMDLQDLLNNLPKLHTDASGKPVSYSLPECLLRYIDKNVDETFKTLETGAGISTILFALKRSHHTCIVPNRSEVDRIITYCIQHQISLQKINFQIDRSENVLPQSEFNELDLVLIDGCHAFPIPFIDWFYTSRRLKVGGKLLIDDTLLWTGDTLKKFLLLEPEWEIIEDFSSRAAVFIKRKEGGHLKYWRQQPFLVLNSKISKINRRYAEIRQAIILIFRGKFLTLIKKIIYKVKSSIKEN